MIPVKFQLTGAGGQPIAPTLAAQLSSTCAATVGLANQPPVCAQYSASANVFQANLKTPSNLSVGSPVTITITVKVATTTVGSTATTITVTK